MAFHLRFERRTYRLTAGCSTTELMEHMASRPGIEPGMTESKSVALPLGYREIMVGRAGFEPAVFLMCQIYSLVESPIILPTHLWWSLEDFHFYSQ